MSYESYSLPTAKGDTPVGVIIGLVFTFLLFSGMALAQLAGDIIAPDNDVEEFVFADQAPELEEFEEEIVEIEEEEEVEAPELEEEPQVLSLDTLDLVLNPGVGGSLAGDFGLPAINANQESLGTADIFDIGELDTKPRPIKRKAPKYPPSLRKKKIQGTVIILFIVDHTGAVRDIQVESSPHPGFEKPAIDAVSEWKFEPGLKDGRKVKTRVRLPIPFKLK